jgi:hypothetical protein
VQSKPASVRKDNTVELEVYDQDGMYDQHDLPSFVRGKKAAAEVQKRAAAQKAHSLFWDSENAPTSAMLAKEISKLLGSLKIGIADVPVTFPAAVGRLCVGDDGWTIGAKMSTRQASLKAVECEMVEDMLREANTNTRHPDHYVKPEKKKSNRVIGAVDHGVKVKTFSFPLKVCHEDRRIIKVVAMKCKQAYNAWVRAWRLTHRCGTSNTKDLTTIIDGCWMNGVCVSYSCCMNMFKQTLVPPIVLFLF